MDRSHKTAIFSPAHVADGKPRVRRNALIPLAVGLTLLVVVGVVVRNNQFESQLHHEAAERSAVVSHFVERDFHVNSDLMSAMLQGLAGRPELAEAFLAGDRALLHSRAQALFEDMHGKRHISHFYFHDLDGRVFLRVHQPESFGDTITRGTLREAVTSGKIISGFERGPYAAFAQRTVAPWESDGKRIGYLELSMELEESSRGLGELLDVEMFAAVPKSQVNRDAWQASLKRYGRDGNWDEFENVIVMDRSTPVIAPQMAEYLGRPEADEGYELIKSEDGRTLVAQSIPVTDLRGNELARLAVFTDVSDVVAEQSSSLLIVFASSALISLGLFGFFFVAFGRVDRRLTQKQAALTQINEALGAEVKVRRGAEEALKAEQSHLEENVRARTKELHDANAALKAEIAARAQAELEFDRMFALTPDMMAVGGFDGHFRRANPAMLQVLGYTEEEMVRPPFAQFVHPDDAAMIGKELARLAMGEEVRDLRFRIRHKDGHYIHTEWADVPFLDRGVFFTMGRDITQREEDEKRLIDANEALKAEVAARARTQTELDQLFTASQDMMALASYDNLMLRVNPSFCMALGYSAEELLAMSFAQLVPAEDMEFVGQKAAQVAAGETLTGVVTRVVTKDGRILHTQWNLVPLPERNLFYATGRDITQREENERRLIDSNEALKAEIKARARTQAELDQLFTASQDLMALASFEDRLVRVNPSFCKAFGYTAEEMVTRPFSSFVPPEDWGLVGERVGRIAAGETLTGAITRIISKDGRIRHTQWNLVPFAERNLFYATGRDITERMELEESLRKSAATLAEAQRVGKVGSWETDLTTGVTEWSDETWRIYGLVPGEMTPTFDLFLSMVHPDDRDMLRRLGGGTPRNGEQRRVEHRIILKDGSVRDIQGHLEFVCAPDGRPLKMRGTNQDITERKQAEANQARLEAQLRSAQKMEAVGNLAGGIAHDFNNLLSVILSYTGFVLEKLSKDDPRGRDLEEVERAAQRAATLTRQLLAYGRKQVLQPIPLSLNDVTEGLQKMLRRIIGEDITLVQNLAPDLGVTMADPGQIEQVTMNLVVNARDAMPRGGRLAIETTNVELVDGEVPDLGAGSYVTLSVSDTGTGMDDTILARLFEPFFTTKEVGKGTGLGLPTVYGIVSQSGGGITVSSTVGVGSTFRVYLPRNLLAVARSDKHSTAPLQQMGDETVLLVEDEAAVRAIAERILTDAGYSVLAAGDGSDGLAICKAFPGPIDLVLTDVVMPTMGGAQFARELAVLRPETRILFMSGYSGDAIAHHGLLEPGTQFIGKPFNALELTRKVRQVLDAEREVYSTDPTEVAVRIKEASQWNL